jgi:hypothetical protein
MLANNYVSNELPQEKLPTKISKYIPWEGGGFVVRKIGPNS